MKRILISILVLASINVFAQSETFTKDDLKELQPLKSSVQTLQRKQQFEN